MKCERPFLTRGGAYACGRCPPCRIDRRRVWTHRILLEAAQYEHNTFATLTYRDEDLPGDGSVSPQELSGFIKRLRSRINVRIRYFGVGEYGDESGRPHYHLALFGFPPCAYGVTRKRPVCCGNCSTVEAAWGKGAIFLGQLEPQSAAYIAGYINKKMTSPDDYRLKGRLPEFARMSLRPGIGIGMMHELASTLMEHKLDEKMIDVPLVLRHGMKQLPLGRYLRRKLRTFIGRPENAPLEALEAQKEELQKLREDAWQDKTSLSKKVEEATLGKRIQIQARERRFKKRSML